MQDSQHLRSKTCPALAQQQVIAVLESNLCELLQGINCVQQLLQVQQLNLPRNALLLNDSLDGVGCIAMPASGIEEDNP